MDNSESNITLEITKQDIVSIQRELDSAKQNIYELKRQISTAHVLEKEYQSEIEILQSEISIERIKLAKTVKQSEEILVEVKADLNKHIQELENELQNKDLIIENLNSELELMKKQNNQNDLLEINELRSRFDLVLEENSSLHESIETLQSLNDQFEKLNLELIEKTQILEKEHEDLREMLDTKKEELLQSNEMIQNLQDEVICLKSELEALKNKPLDIQAKGNSLFSEVDDRRVQLQSVVNSMKTKYLELKKERTQHLNTITHLQKQYAVLSEQWEREKSDDIHTVEKAYKNTICTLEQLIESYKKQLDEKPVQISSLSSEGMAVYESILSTKKKEIRALQEKIAQLSLSERTLSYQLVQTNREIFKWKLHTNKLETDISKLKSEIQNLLIEKSEQEAARKNVAEFSEKEQQPILKSNLKKTMLPVEIKSGKEVSLDDLVSEVSSSKENLDISNLETKKVTFSKDTAESNSLSKVAVRPRGKVKILKPTPIIGLPKSNAQ